VLGIAAALMLTSAPDTVLLLRAGDAEWSAFEERVTDELYASGFAVKTLTVEIAPEGDVPGQLALRCQEENALAALWFHPHEDGRVDAWVADRVTGKAVVRTWDKPATRSARATLALKAVELLHASLLEVRLLEPKERAEVPEVAEAAVRPYLREPKTKPHFVFGTGLGLAVTPGPNHLRPQPFLEVQLGYAVSRSLTIDIELATSVWPVNVQQPEGSADFGMGFLRLMAGWTPLSWRDLSAGLIAGTGGWLLWGNGTVANGGLDARFDAQVAWLLTGGLEVALQLIEGVRLQLLATVGVCLPRLGVQFAERDVTVVGQPLFDFLLRLEFE
jgi:hypothetical protein